MGVAQRRASASVSSPGSACGPFPGAFGRGQLEGGGGWRLLGGGAVAAGQLDGLVQPDLFQGGGDVREGARDGGGFEGGGGGAGPGGERGEAAESGQERQAELIRAAGDEILDAGEHADIRFVFGDGMECVREQAGAGRLAARDQAGAFVALAVGCGDGFRIVIAVTPGVWPAGAGDHGEGKGFGQLCRLRQKGFEKAVHGIPIGVVVQPGDVRHGDHAGDVNRGSVVEDAALAGLRADGLHPGGDVACGDVEGGAAFGGGVHKHGEQGGIAQAGQEDVARGQVAAQIVQNADAVIRRGADVHDVIP